MSKLLSLFHGTPDRPSRNPRGPRNSVENRWCLRNSWLGQLILQMKRLPEELENNLPCKSLKRHKIGRAVFEVTYDVFSEQKIKWQWYEAADMCANGAVAMAAGLSGLVLWAKKRRTVTTGKSWLQRIWTQYYLKPSQGLWR